MFLSMCNGEKWPESGAGEQKTRDRADRREVDQQKNVKVNKKPGLDERARPLDQFQYFLSSVRYCTASETCSTVISSAASRSAMVRATFRMRV